jgi:hypothetical protein
MISGFRASRKKGCTGGRDLDDAVTFICGQSEKGDSSAFKIIVLVAEQQPGGIKSWATIVFGRNVSL